jgi:hypothetical protein
MTTIRAYHGGEIDGATWFTTDRDHASLFGPVTEVELESSIDPLRLSADDVEALVGFGGGYESDARLWTHINAADASWAILDGWEGAGLCIIIREPQYVRVTEVE